jgi:class 3 adenylate cyclase/uncharacterized protein YjiS (DUF1127 family)
MNTTFRTTGLAQTTGSTRRVFSLFRRYCGAFQEWRKRERLCADLCGLNDTELHDIGITRGEADYVAIADIAMLLRHVRLVPIIDISLGGHSSCLALPSDPSYNNLWVGLRAMVQERPVRVERRLSAILAADVAGYSRLMHSDEETTHAKLTALIAGGVEPAIAEHGGRVVKNTGDGFLAEFPSAVEAVRAAVQFQARINELTNGEVEERRIAFRVGVNVGDVIVEPHDIFGDGVNIAARLESIAEPGGVCISSAVYDQVQGKVGVEFADLGEQDLKNIARPIRAYAVVRAGSGPAIQSGRARPTPFSPPPLSIAGRSRSSILVPHRSPPSRSSSRHFQDRSLTPVQKAASLCQVFGSKSLVPRMAAFGNTNSSHASPRTCRSRIGRRSLAPSGSPDEQLHGL